MERWNGKVAVVTGASSGIGLETAKVLVLHGMIVVGLARRKFKMEQGMKDVTGPGKFYARECDITVEQNIIEALEWAKKSFGTINVLVNNAGASNLKRIEDSSTAEIDNLIKVNLMGPLYTSKNAIKIMRENQQEAHIVNINSILGHQVPPPIFGPMNVYPATKFALRALSETLKNELLDSRIRVSNISPGLVKTAMFDEAEKKVPQIQSLPALKPEDVANAIIYVLCVPPTVEINELTIQAKFM